MATRVLLLTQWFDPEPSFKGLAFAQELRRQGVEVVVLTGIPNYPGGRVYPGYRVRCRQVEQMDGITVIRVPLYPSHNHSGMRRILNYVSFAIAAFLRGWFMARDVDVVYAYHPPLTVGLVAALLRGLRRVPVVYDIQDMWPDTLRATGMIGNPRLLRWVGCVCQWVYARVDSIVVLSPGFERLLRDRGVPADRLQVVYNWANEAALAGPATANLPAVMEDSGHFRILFAGNMGRAQALDAVLEAASRLKASAPRVSFVFLGGGVDVDRLKARAAELGLSNVVFLSPVPMSNVGPYLAAADALLVHLRDDPLFEMTIPSKTQAYMAMGKPLLMAVRGDAAELVNRAGAGVLAEPENADSIADAASTLAGMPPEELQRMGNRGKAFYDRELALQIGVSKFVRLFEALRSQRTKGVR